MIIFILLFGLVIGSFLNVCIYRIPAGQSIAYPPSHCPGCDTQLKPWDLIPVVSYLCYKGKCRYCGQKISSQYALVESLNAMIYLLMYLQYGYSMDFVQYGLLASLLIVISFIDYEYQIIPDGLILFGFILALLFNGLSYIHNPLLIKNDILGFLLGGGFFLLIAIVTNGAMGGGDIKLMALLGFWMGWQWILLIMFLSFITGALISILLLLLEIKQRKDAIPFAPFIGLATGMTIFFGNDIIFYYMTYFF